MKCSHENLSRMYKFKIDFYLSVKHDIVAWITVAWSYCTCLQVSGLIIIIQLISNRSLQWFEALNDMQEVFWVTLFSMQQRNLFWF